MAERPMWKDPIVEEVRRIREAYGSRFNHDLDAICDDLKRKQQTGGREVVSFPAKRATRAPSPRLHKG